MAKNKFGLIGHPVKYSMSAVMHNAAFKKLGLPYKYELFDVEACELDSFMGKAFDFAGLNVTIPHKMEVIRYLDGLSREAALIGAVNTIKTDGKKIGYNTDGMGCMKALEENGVRVKGESALVLGSGGAARAVVYQLALDGAEISIANRTHDKALMLAKEVGEKTGAKTRAVECSDAEIKKAVGGCSILINATSVGMHPKVNDTPIKKEFLRKDLVVMDLVYNPVETRLLKESHKQGCKTIDGVGMLVHQGAESLRIWLEINPPIEVMKKAVVKGLS